MSPARLALAAVPYAASATAYWLAAREVFASSAGTVPSNAALRLSTPVLIGGGLTPLALAAGRGTHVLPLLIATAVSIVYVFACLLVTRTARAYLRLFKPMNAAGRVITDRLYGRDVLMFLGVASIAYGAVATLVLS